MAVPGKKATKEFSLSTLAMGSDEEVKVYCQPCDRDGPRHSAHGYCINCSEHLCETCFTVHRRHKLSRHHTLLDKVNMPQSMSFVAPQQVYLDKLTKPCPKHNSEMIKFYCHDHEVLLCSVCVTTEHNRTSCTVNYIPDVSSQVINSKEYQDILKTLNVMTKETNAILQDKKKMYDNSDKSLRETLTDIKKFRTKLNQRLDELEEEIEEAANVIQQENSKNAIRIEKECRDLSKSLKVFSHCIAQFNSSEQAKHLFMELKQAQQMIKDYEQKIDKFRAFDIKEHIFQPNEALSNLAYKAGKENSMGTLKSRSLSRTLKSRQLSHMFEVSVKTTEDRYNCVITGMALMIPDLLIITDQKNKAVKMVDISKMSVIYQQKVNSEPWDVSSVSHDEIAVTITKDAKIQFMSVSRNTLKMKHSVKVDAACIGISCHKDKMVVSFFDPVKIQILLVNGTVLQTIQNENIFMFPTYVTSSNNYIYVSDFDMKMITKLNWHGEVKDIRYVEIRHAA